MSTDSTRVKGNNLIALPDDYVVIDLETTDLDPFYGEIIEFGAMRVVNNTICETFETLVKPNESISSFISELTGITNEMVADAPCITDALHSFLDFVGDSIVIGHNINFDINFIYDFSIEEFDIPFSNDFIDTMRIARRLYPEEKHHRLKDLIKLFSIECSVMHRAMADADYTNKCYQHMKNYMLENGITPNDITPKRKNSGFKVSDITTDITEFDESSPIFGNCFVFTGALDKMTRQQAMQKVVDHGGSCGNSITKKTNYLVIGNLDYCSSIKGNKSSKMKKAEDMRLAGIDIQIISETVFYDMLMEE